MVEAVFWDAPEMIPTVKCESSFTHYLPNGGIITGPTQDYGVMQIHAPSHQKRMEKMGLDITDIRDNISFARTLYDEAGNASDWVCAQKLALVR